MSDVKYASDNEVHTWEVEWAGKPLKIKTGQFAFQADATVTVQYGETVVLATAIMGSKPREGMSYFPLLVDYEEKFYASGKIKGSRFIKREGRPSDEAVLSGRIVDRSIRPFFDDSSRIDVQVVVQILSWDGENSPETLAIIAASAALHISNIPWDGPVAAVRVNQVDGQLVTNASYEQRETASLDLLVSVRGDKTIMIEAEGTEPDEATMLQGFELAVEQTKPVLELIEAMREKVGQEKRDIKASLTDEETQRRTEIEKLVTGFVGSKIEDILAQSDKSGVKEALSTLEESVKEHFKDDAEYTSSDLELAMYFLEVMLLKTTKDMYLNKGQRIDGRAFDQVRDLSIAVGVLPRPHGTGVFQRGETQALTVLTLGSPSSEQILDTMELTDVKKRYMHHYNFPGFSVGEVKPNRGASRRDIGHGALAEKALKHMIPAKDKFPYTIRLVSEIMGSNGSSSMAATCGSTLALMDGGVPIKAPVAGIAMGIMTDDDPSTGSGQDRYRIMTDIQGAEDHYGEMDFKIAGTAEGITAIQLDVKNKGVTLPMIKETLDQAKAARLHILEAIKQVIAEPRAELSKHAPRIYTLNINPEKIGDVIGPKGKIINEIIEVTGVAIDIEDDGLVMITSTDSAMADKAIAWVEDLTREAVVGEIYQGKVVRLMDFGAFVEILPNKDGMVHISELAPWRVAKVEDVVKLGDTIPVKVMEIDDQGRINLSLKQTDYEYPPEVKAKAESGNGNGDAPHKPSHSNRRPPARRR